MPNLEEEVAKIPDKEGWITMNDFKKYAIGNSELCKVEFVDRVFQKSDPDEDRKQKEAKATKVKVNVKNKYIFTFFLYFLNALKYRGYSRCNKKIIRSTLQMI